jgi:hypothetical protein
MASKQVIARQDGQQQTLCFAEGRSDDCKENLLRPSLHFCNRTSLQIGALYGSRPLGRPDR